MFADHEHGIDLNVTAAEGQCCVDRVVDWHAVLRRDRAADVPRVIDLVDLHSVRAMETKISLPIVRATYARGFATGTVGVSLKLTHRLATTARGGSRPRSHGKPFNHLPQVTSACECGR